MAESLRTTIGATHNAELTSMQMTHSQPQQTHQRPTNHTTVAAWSSLSDEASTMTYSGHRNCVKRTEYSGSGCRYVARQATPHTAENTYTLLERGVFVVPTGRNIGQAIRNQIGADRVCDQRLARLDPGRRFRSVHQDGPGSHGRVFCCGLDVGRTGTTAR